MSDDTDLEVGHDDDGEQFDGGHLPADPEQVARRLHEERRYLGSHEPPWEDLTDDERSVGVALIVALLALLRDEGTKP
jgi:hypothetical protein